MKETTVETYLRKQVEQLYGKCWKWVSPGRRGVPDRIVLLPGGVVFFVETKAPGKTEGDTQKHVHRMMRALGARVYHSVDSNKKVDEILEQERKRGDAV